jgi:hypothetical protein
MADWDPGRFRHTALKFRTKSRQGWGPCRRRSGPHLRAKISRYFNSLWSIWRGSHFSADSRSDKVIVPGGRDDE